MSVENARGGDSRANPHAPLLPPGDVSVPAAEMSYRGGSPLRALPHQ